MLLLIKPGVRSLLYFQENSVLQHPEAVSTARHQHDVSGTELSAGDQRPRVIVNIDFAASPPNDDHFRRAHEVPLESKMHMTLDFASGWIDDEAHLLFQVRRRQKRCLLRINFSADDVGHRLTERGNVFYVFHLTDS